MMILKKPVLNEADDKIPPAPWQTKQRHRLKRSHVCLKEALMHLCRLFLHLLSFSHSRVPGFVLQSLQGCCAVYERQN